MKRNIFYMLSLVLDFTSCTKWLEEENRTRYSADYIYSTDEGLKMAVNALYTLLRNYGTDDAAVLALERATDLAVTNGGTGNYFGIYDPNNLRSSSSQVAFMWQTMYNIIGKANEIIYAGEQLPDTDALRSTVAEAKCFLELAYIILFRTYVSIWV